MEAKVNNHVGQLDATSQVMANAQPQTHKGEEKNSFKKFGKKKRSRPIIWTVLSKAKMTFMRQIDKSNDLKLRCVTLYISSDAQDTERFWLHYRDQVDVLLDSKRFERECLSKKLSPAIVAEHIVFDGSATIRRVLQGGLTALGNEVELYRERFTGSCLEDCKGVSVEETTSDEGEK